MASHIVKKISHRSHQNTRNPSYGFLEYRTKQVLVLHTLVLSFSIYWLWWEILHLSASVHMNLQYAVIWSRDSSWEMLQYKLFNFFMLCGVCVHRWFNVDNDMTCCEILICFYTLCSSGVIYHIELGHRCCPEPLTQPNENLRALWLVVPAMFDAMILTSSPLYDGTIFGKSILKKQQK